MVELSYWETLSGSIAPIFSCHKLMQRTLLSTIILRSQRLEIKTERVFWRNIYREANNILEVTCSKSHYVCIFKQEGKKNKSIPATIPGVGAPLDTASTLVGPQLPPRGVGSVTGVLGRRWRAVTSGTGAGGSWGSKFCPCPLVPLDVSESWWSIHNQVLVLTTYHSIPIAQINLNVLKAGRHCCSNIDRGPGY